MNDQTPITKRDLVEQNVEKVIDKNKAMSVAVSADLGGTGFKNMLEVIESAKMMAMAGAMIPKWLQGNPGGCWGIILQAIEWKFSPLSVAKMSFEVNGNVAYMSQLVHAVIEARAPLKTRLRCDYEGEGFDRACIVTGTFVGDDNPQIYRSPMFKDINPKNSPLWKNDPDQQLWYFASRAWCRRFAPDVLLGVYSKDELLDNPAIAEASESARDVSPGLVERLANGEVSREEGHRPGHVDSELEQVAAGGQEILPLEQITTESEPKKKRGRKPKSAAEPKPAEQPPPTSPKNAREWGVYCTAWVKATNSHEDIRKRWDAERQLRNSCGVTSEERVPIQNLMIDRCKELGESQ